MYVCMRKNCSITIELAQTSTLQGHLRCDTILFIYNSIEYIIIGYIFCCNKYAIVNVPTIEIFI